MGGFGSGRRRDANTATVEKSYGIDITDLDDLPGG
jgi:hypothetical protein